MTSNTYQVLCDSVGAYEERTRTYCNTSCCVEPPAMRFECPKCKERNEVTENYKNYPPKSADQRERLEELILNLGRLSYHKNDIYYICILSRVNNVNNGMAGTRPDALYALTHKLYKEGVLSKEEVKEVLCQTH